MKFKSVKYLHDYVIEVVLENGTKKQYDFEKWLFSDINPMFYGFRKITNFKKVKTHGYLIIFGNKANEMEFPYEHLKDMEVKNFQVSV